MNKNIYLEITKYLKELISGTEYEGHVFAVGGCVCKQQGVLFYKQTLAECSRRLIFIILARKQNLEESGYLVHQSMPSMLRC